MLNPTFSGGGSPAATSVRRRYLGSQALTTSGSWSKAAARALTFLDGVHSAELEIDLECIGGGGGAPATSNEARIGGWGARPTWRRGLRLADMPDSVPVTVGAGAAATTNNNSNAGGDTQFGSMLLAPGGARGFIPPADTPMPTHGIDGPGSGGGGPASVRRQAENGLSQRPDLRTLGGQVGANATIDGQSAASPFQYGAGGADGGGAGGSPGGGGGSTVFGSATGVGGGGAVRLHYYVWEVA